MALTEVPIELSSTPGIIDNSTGTAITIDSSNNTNFADNAKAIFGAGSDLQIYHGGSDSFITDNGTGDLKISGEAQIKLGSVAGEFYATFNNNSSVNLYYDNALKLATTATGIDVTGTVTADGLTVDGNITLGAGDKLQYNSDRYFTPENNVDGAEVSANGVFRIKTGTTPAARLLVAGNGDISFYEDTGTTPKLFWDASAESLGIGTASPRRKLEVSGVAGANVLQSQDTADSTNFLRMYADVASGAAINVNTGGVIRFCHSAEDFTSFSEAMRIDSSGNLLVGGTSYEQAGSIGFKPTGEYACYLASGAGGEIFAGAIALVSNGYQISVTTGNAQTYKWHNGTTRSMTLDASGNLLVGTTSSAGKFTLVSNQYNAMSVQVNADGNVGVSWKNGAGSEVGYIQVNTSSTLYSTSSDQRLKDNIVDAPFASDDIDAIQVRSFDWKADGSHQKYGMVAQELQTVAPEAVSVPEDPEKMMGVDYSKLVPMLVKEIQSLRARVAQLES